MSWTLASVYMYIGYAIRRPHWEPNKTIRSVRREDHFIVTEFSGDESAGSGLAGVQISKLVTGR